jgi:hypothetical protein
MRRIPLPGKVAYISVTFSGVLKPGAKPTLTQVAYGRTTVKFYFAIKNIAMARRLAIAPAPQVDIFGNSTQWSDVQLTLPAILTCLQMKLALLNASYLYAVFSFGDPPEEMWHGALKLCT